MEGKPENTFPGGKGSDLNGYLFVALGLIAIYVMIAAVFDGFALPFSTEYYGTRSARMFMGLDPRFARDFTPALLWSVLARATFLLPACIVIAFFLGRRLPQSMILSFSKAIEKWSTLRVLTAITLTLAVLMIFWSQLVYRGEPVYDDELTYAFQAETYLTGKLAADPPPCPECFYNVFILLKNGVWAGKYTAGHPLILAVSKLLGSFYILPILLSSLIPLLSFYLVRKLYNERLALLSSVLFVFSPFFLFVTSTLMNHGTCLFFLLLFANSHLRSERDRSWLHPIIAGLALGIAFNIRPQSAVAFGLPFAIWTTSKLLGKKRRQFLVSHLVMLAFFLVPLAFALHYNKVVTGDYLRFPFIEAEPTSYSLWSFFSVSSQVEPGHDLSKAIYYAVVNFWRMNNYLFGWGISLLFVLVTLAGRLFKRVDLLWAGVIASTILVYLWFPSPGVLEIGPRYYFPMLLPMLIWSAQGMAATHEFMIRRLAGSPTNGKVIVPVFVVLMIVSALTTFYQEQMRHYQNLSEQVARPYDAVEQSGISNAIVSVKSKPPSGWVFGLKNNNPDLSSNNVLYVWSTEASNLLTLMNAFPDRKAYGLWYDISEDHSSVKMLEFTREMIEDAARNRDMDTKNALDILESTENDPSLPPTTDFKDPSSSPPDESAN